MPDAYTLVPDPDYVTIPEISSAPRSASGTHGCYIEDGSVARHELCTICHRMSALTIICTPASLRKLRTACRSGDAGCHLC